MKVQVSLFDYLEQMYHGEILINSRTNKVAFANKAFCRMLGFSLSELKHMKDIIKIFHPSMRVDVKESIENNTPINEETEFRLIDSAGEIIWTKGSSLTATFESKDDSELNGKYSHFTFVDISKHRAFLDTLPDMLFKMRVFKDDLSQQQNLKVLRRLKNPSPNKLDLLRYIDPQLSYLNETAITTLQHGISNVREKSIFDIIDLGETKIKENILSVVMNGSKAGKFNLIDAMGSKIPCDVFCTLEDNKMPMYIYGIARNVSQTQIRQEVDQTRFQAVVNQLDCLVCRYTPNFKLTFVNKRFSEHMGVNPKRLLGKSYLDRFPLNMRDILKAKLSKINLDNKNVTSEYVLANYKGMQRIYSWIDHGIFIDDKLVEVQVVGRDITNEKRIQKEHDSVMQDANHNVLLSKSSKSLYLIVNNRLRRIAEILDHLSFNSEDQKGNIIDEIIGASDSIKELVDFYEPRTMTKKNVPINTVMTNAVASIYKNINIPSNISITSMIKCNLIIKVDPSNIISAIEAIARNSIDAIRATVGNNTFKLGIRCNVVDLKLGDLGNLKEGKYINICIQDNGPGILPKMKEHVFDPFVTSNPSEKVGLGLATVERIVEYHNGEVFINSNSKGTRVNIYLPDTLSNTPNNFNQIEMFA